MGVSNITDEESTILVEEQGSEDTLVTTIGNTGMLEGHSSNNIPLVGVSGLDSVLDSISGSSSDEILTWFSYFYYLLPVVAFLKIMYFPDTCMFIAHSKCMMRNLNN